MKQEDFLKFILDLNSLRYHGNNLFDVTDFNMKILLSSPKSQKIIFNLFSLQDNIEIELLIKLKELCNKNNVEVRFSIDDNYFKFVMKIFEE